MVDSARALASYKIHFFFLFAKNSTFTFLGTFFVALKDTFSPLLVMNFTLTFLGTFLVAVKLTFFLRDFLGNYIIIHLEFTNIYRYLF